MGYTHKATFLTQKLFSYVQSTNGAKYIVVNKHNIEM
jgi:hypothetical protein